MVAALFIELVLDDLEPGLPAVLIVGGLRIRARGADEGREEGGGGGLGFGWEAVGVGGGGGGGGEAEALFEACGALALAAELVVVGGRLLFLHRVVFDGRNGMIEICRRSTR